MTPEAPPRAATITDVARAAGVSVATVSRVMNGRTTVAPQLAERVLRSVAELAYAPSTVARSLSLGATSTVGMVVPDLANPMFQQVLAGFNGAASGDGYRVLVADSREDPSEELELAREIRKRTDAIVLCAPRSDRTRLTRSLAGLGPVVVINRPRGRSADAPVVTVDYAAGIRTLAAHLEALGHRRLLYLAGPGASASNSARLRGLAAFRNANPGVEVLTQECGATLEDGYRSWDPIRRSGATGVLAFNDLVALGLLGRLNEEGVSVPDELSVTGFDDIGMSRFAAPPLTTMAVDQTALGNEAWQQLRRLIDGGLPRASTTFHPALVVRASTAAPR